MKNKDEGKGEGAINFPPLKRGGGGGGLIREGGLNRGFTVLSSVNVKNRDLSVSRRSINCLGK